MASAGRFQGFGSNKDEKKAAKPNFVIKKGARKGPILLKKNEAALTDLKKSLDSQPKFGKMVIYSVECVDKLAVDESSAEEVIESGMIETMMKILALNPDNEAIHTSINKCLKTLAKNDRLAALIAARINGDYKPFADSLAKHVEPETIIATCGTVSALTRGAATKEVVEAMAKAGMADSLCTVVSKHHSNIDILTAATEALGRFGELPQSAVMILHSGAVPHILQGMRDHPENLALVVPAAALIANLAKNGGKNAAEMLQRMGAVDCLVAALEAHPFSDALTGYASEALKHLTGTNDMGLALAPVTSGDVRLDAKTAAALSRIAALALVGDNVDFMYQNNGVDWLLSIMKNAVGQEGAVNGKILANGVRILKQAACSEQKTYDLMKKGAVPLLTSIVVGHMDDPLLVAGTLSALAKMMSRKENAVYIGNKGALSSAMGALKQHPMNEAVVKSALEVFLAMAVFPESADILVKAGGIKEIMEILRTHINNPEICNSAIQALGRLATSEENVKSMIDNGLLASLVDVLKKHPSNAELAKTAMMAMDTTLLLPETSGKLKKLNALDVIGNVMGTLPDDAEIQDLGMRLQEAISGEAEKRLAEEAARLEQEQMAMVEAERMRAAEAEAGRLRSIQEEQDRLETIRMNRVEAERQAELARLRELEARKLEQDSLEAEMAAALEAMKASAANSRLKAMQEEERKKQDDEKARLESEREAARLRALEQQRSLEEIEKKRREIERLKLDMKKKEEEESQNRQVFNLLGRRPEAAEKDKKDKPKIGKSAREIFDADEEKDKQLAELPIPIKNFLLAGAVLTKHSNSAVPKPRHLYLSHDIEWLIWKDPKKAVSMKQRMRIYKIYGVNAGRCTPQLSRKRLGKFLAKEDCCFSIYGADVYEEERTVDVETNTPKEAQVWMHALEVLIEYAKNKMMYGQQQVAMRSDKELAKLGHQRHGDDSDDDDSGVQFADAGGQIASSMS